MIKKLIHFIVVSFVSLSAWAASEKEVADALDRALYNHEMRRPMNPGDPLWLVMSTVHWNDSIGEIKSGDKAIIKENIVSDTGLVAKVLLKQGYNYHVLVRLRPLIGYDPHDVSYEVTDIAGLKSTAIGSAKAGIPEFARVQTDHWETNHKGELKILYDAQVSWLIERAKRMVDRGIRAADQARHTPVNLVVNRFKLVEATIDFSQRMEKILTEYQALQASVEIKIARYEGQAKIQSGLIAVKRQLLQERSGFLKWVEDVLERGQPSSSGDKTPWRELGRAMQGATKELGSLEAKFKELSSLILTQVDKVTGNTGLNARYANDLEPELEMKRHEQLRQHQDFKAQWDEIGERTYFRRNHTWTYIHKHSEQHGPYIEKSRSTKSRAVNDIALPPIEEEAELVDKLMAEGQRILKTKLQAPQILELRQRLIALQAQHAEHFGRGPVLPEVAPDGLVNGFNEHFQARNQLLAQWLEMLIDSSYRHEAHEKKGYVGIEFESELRADYAIVLAKLKKIARRFRIANYTIGGTVAAGAGATCYYFLQFH